MKYKLIYADPPWQYDNVTTGRNNVSGSANKYKTMSLEAICDYPLPEHEKQSAVFMWCTTPLLPYGFEVLSAWGFKYKTAIYWHKTQSLGLGNYFRGQVEVLLVATKGKLKPFRCQKANFLQAKPQKHSKKPQEIYGLLESLDLNPKIELFARERRVGWDARGDELPHTLQTLLCGELQQ